MNTCRAGVSVRLCAPLPVCTKGVVVAVADTGGRRGLKSGLEVHFTFKPRRVNKGSSSAQDTRQSQIAESWSLTCIITSVFINQSKQSSRSLWINDRVCVA